MLLEIIARRLPLAGVARIKIRGARAAAADEVTRKAAGLALDVARVPQPDEQAKRLGVADLVTAVDVGDQFHLEEQIVVMLHQLPRRFTGGMILEHSERGAEIARLQFRRQPARRVGHRVAERLQVSLRVRQHENRVADFLEVADLRRLLACDIREVARAEVGVEPKLEDERARLVGGHGSLQRVERGGLAEALERRLAVLHVQIEVGLVAVLVLCEVEVRGGLLQL